MTEQSILMACFMITLTTLRLRLSPFNASDWPFFLRLRQDPQVMRYMGEVLEESALRALFESRCADPGVFVLRDASGAAMGDIGLRISSKNPHEADVGYALLPEAQGAGTGVRPRSATSHLRLRI
ncbi:GNAT family N-acetyltransferase [Klebsiella spallanzanii]|uniref:GNAT family N-acetyltransferase n=1 Tax=Klebsiella spallanzanii TaxID=2587528 RepID=UPI0039A1B818